MSELPTVLNVRRELYNFVNKSQEQQKLIKNETIFIASQNLCVKCWPRS